MELSSELAEVQTILGELRLQEEGWSGDVHAVLSNLSRRISDLIHLRQREKVNVQQQVSSVHELQNKLAEAQREVDRLRRELSDAHEDLEYAVAKAVNLERVLEESVYL